MTAAVFKTSKWIWPSESKYEIYEYADFITTFNCKDVNGALLRICSKSGYAVWINKVFVGFNQYRDFPDYKVYDEYDISTYLKFGSNTLAIKALSKNDDHASHIADGKGIIFEICCSDDIVASDQNILSRVSLDYKSGDMHYISSQLGRSFSYDFTTADNWLEQLSGKNFAKSSLTNGGSSFFIRPVERLTLNYLPAQAIKDNLFDLGGVRSGYLNFNIIAPENCNMVISFGEHIIDGGVRRNIHDRDFSVEFKLKKGENIFTEYFLRFGLRYLQIECSAELLVKKIGILESLYPLKEVECSNKSINQEIYKVAVQTLKNCVHEHYEDCPWREQAQYTMDSRTQMLCGYYAFNEYRMPRAALKLMGHRLTDDNRLPLTSPYSGNLSIGNFSFVYLLALVEYVKHSQDKSLLAEVFTNIKTMMDGYIAEVKDGLLPTLACWNFFEWSEGLHNETQIFKPKANHSLFALPLNAFFIVGLQSFAYICDCLGYNSKPYIDLAKKVKTTAHKRFYDKKLGLYHTYSSEKENYHLCEYTQVVALYAQIASEPIKNKIIDVIISKDCGGLQPMTLSSYIYKFEVLLANTKYHKYIADEINRIWGKMISQGATSFWETILGASDFGGAGSLCHGWSALPAYICFKLK